MFSVSKIAGASPPATTGSPSSLPGARISPQPLSGGCESQPRVPRASTVQLLVPIVYPAALASPRESWSAPLSRAWGVAQARVMTSFMSGRSFAVPSSLST